MKKNFSEVDYVKHMKRITKGELWKLVETRRQNIWNIGVTDEIMERDKTEYSSHKLAEVVDGENSNDRILVESSRIGNLKDQQDNNLKTGNK